MTTETEPQIIPVGIKVDGKGVVVECTSGTMAQSLLMRAVVTDGDMSMVEFGQWLNEWYEQPFSIGERTVKMFEAHAILEVAAENRRQQAALEAIQEQTAVIEQFCTLTDDELFWMTVDVHGPLLFSDSEPFHFE